MGRFLPYKDYMGISPYKETTTCPVLWREKSLNTTAKLCCSNHD